MINSLLAGEIQFLVMLKDLFHYPFISCQWYSWLNSNGEEQTYTQKCHPWRLSVLICYNAWASQFRWPPSPWLSSSKSNSWSNLNVVPFPKPFPNHFPNHFPTTFQPFPNHFPTISPPFPHHFPRMFISFPHHRLPRGATVRCVVFPAQCQRATHGAWNVQLLKAGWELGEHMLAEEWLVMVINSD